jgi:hypothetical protein
MKPGRYGNCSQSQAKIGWRSAKDNDHQRRNEKNEPESVCESMGEWCAEGGIYEEK